MRQVLQFKKCKLRAQGLRSLGSVPGFREFRLADCSFRVLRAFGPASNAGASIGIGFWGIFCYNYNIGSPKMVPVLI